MSRLRLNKVGTPSQPAANSVELYIDTLDKCLKQIDDANVVTTLAFKGAVTTGPSGAINTAETIISVPFVIPVNSLKIGSTYRIIILGTCTSTAANVSTFRVRYGSLGTIVDAIIATFATSVAATSGTTIPFRAVMEFTFRTIGAAGSLMGSLTLNNTGITGISANQSQVVPLVQTTAPNTTTANNVEVTYQSAAVTTTCTFQNVIIECVQP